MKSLYKEIGSFCVIPSPASINFHDRKKATFQI